MIPVFLVTDSSFRDNWIFREVENKISNGSTGIYRRSSIHGYKYVHESRIRRQELPPGAVAQRRPMHARKQKRDPSPTYKTLERKWESPVTDERHVGKCSMNLAN